MNPIDAVRLMAKHYPGGVDALAVLVGKSGETLRKELASAHGYKLGVNDACTISEACIAAKSDHCHAYANAVAVNCGGFVRLEVREQAPGKTLMSATVGSVSSSTDLLELVTTARADGLVSDNERKDIERAVTLSIEKLQHVLAEVQRENETGKPLRAV
jgi:hypothetical protein